MVYQEPKVTREIQVILVKQEGQELGGPKVQLANQEDLVTLEHRVKQEMMADQVQ